MYRVLIGALAIFLVNTSFALDSEFKNTLNKIELNKTSDSSYSVDLYTSKEYSEPVKVIKKNDLNYYILLPETKNSASVALPSNLEIKNVNTQLFPYAGADVKNGYTKINIVTSKPIDFKINTKTKAAAVVKKPVEPEVKKDEVKTAVEPQLQKKNSEVLAQKLKPSLESEKSKIASKPKQEIKDTPKKNNVVLKPETQKTQIRELKKEVAAAAKIITDKKEEIENKTIEQKQLQQEIAQNEDSLQSSLKENPEENKEPEKEKNTEQKSNVAEDIEVVKELPSASEPVLVNIQNKLSEYGLSLRELILMILAGVISFVVALLILTKQKDGQTRLKSKAEFIEKTTNKNSTLVAKKSSKKENKNQYFIFDKNVKQTGLSAPLSGKNYELSSYSPIPEDSNAKVEPYVSKRVKSEYDIIQNILKEDAFIELTENEITQDIEIQPVSKEEKETKQEEIKKEPEEIIVQSNSDEPQVLSSVEIAPRRGFMCVSYNNTINLMGYIFDDIFALYNFAQPKLEDYTIKFRMSEKTKQGANFLVRIGKSKMLVSVTKSSMSLEVAM